MLTFSSWLPSSESHETRNRKNSVKQAQGRVNIPRGMAPSPADSRSSALNPGRWPDQPSSDRPDTGRRLRIRSSPASHGWQRRKSARSKVRPHPTPGPQSVRPTSTRNRAPIARTRALRSGGLSRVVSGCLRRRVGARCVGRRSDASMPRSGKGRRPTTIRSARVYVSSIAERLRFRTVDNASSRRVVHTYRHLLSHFRQ